MGPFVHTILFSLEPAATRDLVARIRSTLEAIGVAKTPGHLASMIFVSDDETRVAIVSEWSDRHAWSRAQWDERMQAGVVDVHQTAKHIESQSYNEVFRFDATRDPR